MGRHAKEADSPVLTATAPSTGRHRQTVRRGPRISLVAFFRRSRHRPHAAPRLDEFRHEGVTPGYIGTLQGINATSRNNLKPIPRPLPPPQPVVSLDLSASDYLDPPTYYRRLATLASTRFMPVHGKMLGSLDIPGA